MSIKQLIVAIGVIISIHCQGQAAKSPESSTKYNLSDIFLKEWNKDHNGCLHLRIKYLDSLNKNKAIIGMPTRQVLKLFGEPNEKSNNNCFTYYLFSKCDVDQKKVKDTDSSWLEFCFKDGKLKDILMEIQ
jgi:hypothetical protein